MRGAAIALVALAGSASADTGSDVRIGSITVEGALGTSYVYNTCTDQTGCPSNGLAPVAAAVAVGEWFTSSSVLELRLADSSERRINTIYTLAFIGPAVQQWIGTRVWLGAGAGIAIAHGAKTSVVFSFDVRAGVVLRRRAQHAWTLSVEAAPATDGEDTSTPVSLLAGYQYL